MRVQAINQSVYSSYVRKNASIRKVEGQELPRANASQVAFKGDKGALWGILGGALTGAGLVAATVLTGGLAGIVAAVGTTGAIATGAAAGTHIGGIAGSIIEESLSNEKKKD